MVGWEGKTAGEVDIQGFHVCSRVWDRQVAWWGPHIVVPGQQEGCGIPSCHRFKETTSITSSRPISRQTSPFTFIPMPPP